MEERIEVFGFSTNTGLLIELHDTTVDEIREAIHKKFPKWSDEAVEKVINHKGFYKKPVAYKPEPKETIKPKVKRGSISKESLCINGYELNPILNLGQSIHVFHKNAYRYWGTITDKIFSDVNVNSKYDKFENAYDAVVVAIKSTPRASKQTITQKVLDMCDKMDDLKAALDYSGLLNQDTDKEYMNGNGRKLGIGELMMRVGEMSGDCTTNLRK
jgi:hypothetical protein